MVKICFDSVKVCSVRKSYFDFFHLKLYFPEKIYPSLWICFKGENLHSESSILCAHLSELISHQDCFPEWPKEFKLKKRIWLSFMVIRKGCKFFVENDFLPQFEFLLLRLRLCHTMWIQWCSSTFITGHSRGSARVKDQKVVETFSWSWSGFCSCSTIQNNKAW